MSSPAPLRRTLWRLDDIDENPEWVRVRRQLSDERHANLLSSLLEDGRHAPAIDLDVPIRIVPSSTPGHHHLTIEKPLSWRQYRIFLRALLKAGLIEKGYYWHSVYRGASFLRRPGVFKKGSPPRNLLTLLKWILMQVLAMFKLLKWNAEEFVERLKDKTI